MITYDPSSVGSKRCKVLNALCSDKPAALATGLLSVRQSWDVFQGNLGHGTSAVGMVEGAKNLSAISVAGADSLASHQVLQKVEELLFTLCYLNGLIANNQLVLEKVWLNLLSNTRDLLATIFDFPVHFETDLLLASQLERLLECFWQIRRAVASGEAIRSSRSEPVSIGGVILGSVGTGLSNENRVLNELVRVLNNLEDILIGRYSPAPIRTSPLAVEGLQEKEFRRTIAWRSIPAPKVLSEEYYKDIAYWNVAWLSPGQNRYGFRCVVSKIAKVLKRYGVFSNESGKICGRFDNGRSVYPKSKAIKVVRGPESDIIVDGHHTFLSALYFGASTIPVQLIGDYRHWQPDDFWVMAERQRLVYLINSNGVSQRPGNMLDLKNDPLRSLLSEISYKLKAGNVDKLRCLARRSESAVFILDKTNRGAPFVELVLADYLYQEGVKYHDELTSADYESIRVDIKKAVSAIAHSGRDLKSLGVYLPEEFLMSSSDRSISEK